MDSPPHSLYDQQVRAHRRVRQRVRDPSKVEAGAALPVANDVQPRPAGSKGSSG